MSSIYNVQVYAGTDTHKNILMDVEMDASFMGYLSYIHKTTSSIKSICAHYLKFLFFTTVQSKCNLPQMQNLH